MKTQNGPQHHKPQRSLFQALVWVLLVQTSAFIGPAEISAMLGLTPSIPSSMCLRSPEQLELYSPLPSAVWRQMGRAGSTVLPRTRRSFSQRVGVSLLCLVCNHSQVLSANQRKKQRCLHLTCCSSRAAIWDVSNIYVWYEWNFLFCL